MSELGSPPGPVSEAPPAPPAPPPYAWQPPGPGPRRRVRPIVVITILAGAIVGAAAVGIPVGLLTRSGSSAPVAGSGSTPSPAAASEAAAAYRQAISAMRASAGFHYVAVTTGTNQRITGDAGQAGGRQLITVTSSYGDEQFTLILVAGTVYFQGNAPAVEDQLGVAASGAASLSGRWVSVVSGDGPYTVLAPGITVADQAQETALVPTSSSSLTSGGRTLTRLSGTVPPQQGAPPGTGHLDIAPDSHLPASYVSLISAGGATLTSTVTFSGWGTAPVVTAPSGAVAWSTLGASEPPGGYGSGGGSAGAPTSTPQGI